MTRTSHSNMTDKMTSKANDDTIGTTLPDDYIDETNFTDTTPVNKNDEINQSASAPQANVDDTINPKIAELEASIAIKDTEIEDWKNKTYRLSADLQNLHKQHDLDMVQASKQGKKSVVQLVLPFINTLHLAFSFVPQTEANEVAAFAETLKQSLTKLIADCKAAGIEFIIPQEGDSINTSYMAVLNSSHDSEEEPVVNKVISVGVRIDGQLVQEASVMV